MGLGHLRFLSSQSFSEGFRTSEVAVQFFWGNFGGGFWS